MYVGMRNYGPMKEPLTIGQAARRLGVSVDTLRRWEREGKITSSRTLGNQRRYDAERIEALAAQVTPVSP